MLLRLGVAGGEGVAGEEGEGVQNIFEAPVAVSGLKVDAGGDDRF